jgi:hypothetical protein
LPLTSNDGQRIDPEMFRLTRNELAARFGGVSFSAQTIHGLWIHQGTRYEDESRRLFVDAEDTPENRAFIAEYKLVLQERFDQVVIYIRSYPIDIF